jgi:hypothetical protein
MTTITYFVFNMIIVIEDNVVIDVTLAHNCLAKMPHIIPAERRSYIDTECGVTAKSIKQYVQHSQFEVVSGIEYKVSQSTREATAVLIDNYSDLRALRDNLDFCKPGSL